MRIVIAPDSFGGTLAAHEAADAIAAGWSRSRPQDEVVTLPLSDGGEGLVDVVCRDVDDVRITEVAGPLGHPRSARWLLRPDGVAVIGSSEACGLALVPVEQRSPLRTTTYGVGQLLAAVHQAGARRVLVGLGGSATVDGGAGALTGLGFRLTVADGSGLKIGGGDLGRVAHAERGWGPDLRDLEVVLLADVTTTLLDAAAVFGPQKGATGDDVRLLTAGLATWADVAERDLAAGQRWRDLAGSGAAGGLGFGLACGIGARFVGGADAVADLVGLDDAVARADVIVTGEGRLDATSGQGKVVGAVARRARDRGLPVLAVAGQAGDGAPDLDAVELSAPDGPGDDPTAEVRDAAARLATDVPRR